MPDELRAWAASRLEWSKADLLQPQMHLDAAERMRVLERFRSYLHELIQAKLAPLFRGKIDVSGVVQQTFLDAVRSEQVHPWHDPSQLAGWLKVLVENNLTDEIRRAMAAKRNVFREQSLERLADGSANGLQKLLIGCEPTPSARAVRLENEQQLVAALAQLPLEQRQAVELHHIQGHTLPDVARQLGRSRSAVAGLLFRGMRSLRKLLQATESP